MSDPKTVAAFRFGYGLPLPPGAAVTPGAMLTALAGPDLMAADYPIPGMAQVLPLLQMAAEGRKARRMMPQAKMSNDMFDAAISQAGEIAENAARSIMARAVDSPDGFRERLSAFWFDHFTVKSRNKPERTIVEAFVTDAIRPHLSGQFADLLIAAVLHPAMLVYLDQVASVGPRSRYGKRTGRGLNENLAREVIELHTMGVGAGYGQQDVRQMAELLTGLDATAKEGFVFRQNRAEPGMEQVLGRDYDGKGLAPIRDVLRDLAMRPETAMHLSRKLVVHFIADDPDEGLVSAMAETWHATGGDLASVYATMLAHPAAWAPQFPKARQPFDFIVASCRALGVNGARIMGMERREFRNILIRPMALMGQNWRNPNGPDGWAEAAGAWITPQGMAARIGWAMRAPRKLLAELPDPRILVSHALGDTADEAVIWAVARAETSAEGVGIVLSSPAFNRR
ncbi:MAG: DUF1800 family protein [Pseudorhodobacter sp.]